VPDPDVRGRLAAAAAGGPELLGRFAGISDGCGDQGRDHPIAPVGAPQPQSLARAPWGLAASLGKANFLGPGRLRAPVCANNP